MDKRKGGVLVDCQFRTSSLWKAVVALALVLSLLPVGISPSAWSQTQEEDNTDSTMSQFGLGVGSVLLTIPYTAAKLAMAILGGITGGFTYALSGGDKKAAKAVWDTSLRGTYVITPDHLKGKRAVRFLGVPQNDQEAGTVEPAQ